MSKLAIWQRGRKSARGGGGPVAGADAGDAEQEVAPLRWQRQPLLHPSKPPPLRSRQR